MSGQQNNGKGAKPPGRKGVSTPPARSGEGAQSALAAMIKRRQMRALHDEPEAGPPSVLPLPATDTMRHDDERRPPDVPRKGGKA